jgi:hypothetical protein
MRESRWVPVLTSSSVWIPAEFWADYAHVSPVPIARASVSAVPSWSIGSVGGGVRYRGAVLRSDAAPGLGN